MEKTACNKVMIKFLFLTNFIFREKTGKQMIIYNWCCKCSQCVCMCAQLFWLFTAVALERSVRSAENSRQAWLHSVIIVVLKPKQEACYDFKTTLGYVDQSGLQCETLSQKIRIKTTIFKTDSSLHWCSP